MRSLILCMLLGFGLLMAGFSVTLGAPAEAHDFNTTDVKSTPLIEVGSKGALIIYTFKDHGTRCWVATRPMGGVALDCSRGN